MIFLVIFFVLFCVIFYFLNKRESFYKKNNTEPKQKIVFQEERTEDKNTNQDIWVETERVETADGRAQLLLSYPLTKNILIDENIKKEAMVFKKSFLKEAEEILILSHEIQYIQHFDLIFSNKEYLMFIIDQSVSTGNNTDKKFKSFIYDKKTGKRLFAKDILRDGYLEVLSRESFAILKKRYEDKMKNFDFGSGTSERAKEEFIKSGIEFIKEGTKAIEKNFQSITFTQNKTLKIYFDKYQVGPGSDGVAEIEIPLKKISSLLKPKFRELFYQEELPLQVSPSTLTENLSYKKHDCSVERCLALTFDDGPSRYTDGLLDILKKKNVRATFFVLGRSAKVQTQTLARAVSEGHQIGNHSWDHRDLAKLGESDIKKEIDQTNEVIKNATGNKSHILRPPYGSQNQKLRELAGMPLILWNVDPEDWKKPGTEAIIERMTKVKRGDIILAHDIHAGTVQAIPRVIDILHQQGYVLVTIDELLSQRENGKRYYSQYLSK